MNLSYNVTFWKTRVRSGRKRPYQVRWVVRGADCDHFSETFATSGSAQSFLAELIQAATKGEAFDVVSGYPVSKVREEEQRRQAISWVQHAIDYVDYKWPRVSAHQRRSIAETLTDATCALLSSTDAPETLRPTLRGAFKRARDGHQPAEIERALKWAHDNSPPLTVLTEPKMLSKVLDAFAYNRDGSPAAASYLARRRRVFYNVLKYAVTKDNRLPSNPLDNPKMDWKTPSDQTVTQEIDPRSVGSTEQITSMLTAVSYIGQRQGPRFVALFACMYYGMLRPEEALGLLDDNCNLPAKGWGTLHANDTNPAPGRSWTDSGNSHDSRGLKQRSSQATRPVPIPPDLVALLRDHIERSGTSPDGHLFRSVNDNPIHPSTYSTVWRKARSYGLAPSARRAGVLRRPYDLRHAGVTARLYAGVPDRQVAEWAGHSVEMLRRVYSQILAGFDDTWQARMDTVFGEAR